VEGARDLVAAALLGEATLLAAAEVGGRDDDGVADDDISGLSII